MRATCVTIDRAEGSSGMSGSTALSLTRRMAMSVRRTSGPLDNVAALGTGFDLRQHAQVDGSGEEAEGPAWEGLRFLPLEKGLDPVGCRCGAHRRPLSVRHWSLESP